MTLSKKQIAEVLFTPTEDGKAKCTICGRSYAPGNGYTNRLSHARTHERYEEVAEEMFVAQEAQRTEDGEPTTSGNSSPSTSTATTAATTTATASGSTTVTSTTGSSATASTTTPAASGPRPRGRPPGSKNKSTLAAAQQQPVESKKRKYEHKENGESASASEDAQVGGSTLPAKLQIAALRKELQAFQTSVLASFQTMRSDVVALKDEVESMRSSINQLTNSDRRVKNRRIADRGDQEAPLHRLIRLNKSLGGGISGGQMFQPPAVAVGEEFPTPPFPKNLAEIDGMQRQQIHELAVLMDNDFGIVSGDNLAMCRTKVHRVLADHD